MSRSRVTRSVSWRTLAVALVAAAAVLLSPVTAFAAPGSFSGVGAPSVSGSGVIGTDFTASFDASGTTPTPTSVDFSWYRVDTGAEVQSGGSTLRATSALLGTGVYVIATLHAADTQDYVTTNSPFSATVRLAEFVPGASPVLSGQHTLGGVLRADIDLSTWTPEPASVTWQWYREDGSVIPDATAAELPVTRALVGAVVYAEATLHASDTRDYVIATAPSGKIAVPGLALSGTTQARAGDTITVTAWGLLFEQEYGLELHSSVVSLGSRTAGSDGTLRTNVTIPATASPGMHEIVLTRGGEVLAAVPLEILPAASGPGASGAGAAAAGGTALARTGGPATSDFIGLGALLMIAGAAAVSGRLRPQLRGVLGGPRN